MRSMEHGTPVNFTIVPWLYHRHQEQKELVISYSGHQKHNLTVLAPFHHAVRIALLAFILEFSRNCRHSLASCRFTEK